MRRTLLWLTIAATVACGSDSPAAPTAPAAPVAPDPIVVTITAQVVANVAPQTMLEAGETLENRNLRVAGSVDVTGGTATIGASGT